MFLPRYAVVGVTQLNASVLIDSVVSLSAIFSSVMPVQQENASLPIEVIELGMVNEVKALQLPNAPEPIEVTELEMFTEVKPVQRSNA
jgi:hypothetical protein